MWGISWHFYIDWFNQYWYIIIVHHIHDSTRVFFLNYTLKSNVCYRIRYNFYSKIIFVRSFFFFHSRIFLICVPNDTLTRSAQYYVWITKKDLQCLWRTPGCIGAKVYELTRRRSTNLHLYEVYTIQGCV